MKTHLVYLSTGVTVCKYPELIGIDYLKNGESANCRKCIGIFRDNESILSKELASRKAGGPNYRHQFDFRVLAIVWLLTSIFWIVLFTGLNATDII